MKWYKVEFELGDYKTDPISEYARIGYFDIKWIKGKVKEYINKMQKDYYLRIRNIKMEEK